MRIRSYILLAVLGAALSIAVSRFQQFPGYLDADYYFGGGLQLAEGKGFTEPYLWNYLDEPRALPHPSYTYWMPLASMISAAGMWVAGESTYAAGRMGFLLLAALVPVLTAALAYQFRQRQDLALTSGLLAVFSGYYAPFLSVTDNYGPEIVLGAVFFMLIVRRRRAASAALGIVAGFLSLARTDGLLWLIVALGAVLLRGRLSHPNKSVEPGSRAGGFSARSIGEPASHLVLILAGFALVMGPWFWRMHTLFGTIFAPGAGRLLRQACG